jgi:hypothetical protein
MAANQLTHVMRWLARRAERYAGVFHEESQAEGFGERPVTRETGSGW